MQKVTCSCICMNVHVFVHNVCVCVLQYVCMCVLRSAGTHEGSREHAVPSFTSIQPQLVARFTAVCVRLVLPEGCGGDVMNHLNEGQGVRCGSTAVTHTLKYTHRCSSSQDTGSKKSKLNPVGAQTMLTDSYLLKERHGKLLVGYAVFGCADVLSALGTDVEVDTHQEVLLRNTYSTATK